jgi:hypothetical protein
MEALSDVHVLLKPFTLSALEALVTRLLERHEVRFPDVETNRPATTDAP